MINIVDKVPDIRDTYQLYTENVYFVNSQLPGKSDSMLQELLLRNKNPLPNKFTKAMGELIRIAREQEGISQSELAEKTYRRQASISDLENGKMEVNATTLILLSAVLKKPLTYFFPEGWIADVPPEKLSSREQELLIQANRLDEDDLLRLIAQARALADLSDNQSLERIYKASNNSKK